MTPVVFALVPALPLLATFLPLVSTVGAILAHFKSLLRALSHSNRGLRPCVQPKQQDYR
jgi:hypothetical protein